MSEMTIREIGQDEDFGHWFHELLEREADGPGDTGPADERFLVLSNEIGDWIGGLRFAFRGGVAQLIEITSGLAPGDTVLVGPAAGVAVGTPVRIVKE